MRPSMPWSRVSAGSRPSMGPSPGARDFTSSCPGRAWCEVITGDKRNLEAASYLVYRVADPLRFLRGSGSLDQAEARLNERVSAALSDAIGRRDLATLATT